MTRVPLPDSFLSLPITHRALHDRAAGRIENSPAAIKAAVAAGYGIEVDLQLSKDGVAMVFHDDDLDRLTDETGRVSARTAAELGRVRLKGSTDTIPTLAEVLDLIGGKVPLLIEIKDQTLTMSPTDAALETATARALEGYRGEVALMSFNPATVAHLARLAPHLPRGITTSAYDPKDWAPLPKATCDRLRTIPDYDATGSSFISHEAADLGRDRVAELKAQGARVLCWTIRSPEAEAVARRVADNVTFEGYKAALPA
jgi:glycerophosphoryl diester phosphodiesterase